MAYIPVKVLEQKLLNFLQEDIEYGDITSDLIPNIQVQATIVAKQEGILCGITFVKILLESLGITVLNYFKDGQTIKPGDIILQLKGSSREILVSERTVLNLLMRLSGIATQTQKFGNKVKNAKQNIVIASTRKTTPGFRYFEKYAVKIGGGDTHRFSLSDTVLIKENHLSLLGKKPIRSILLQSQTSSSFTKKIDIEVENLIEFKEALKLSPDIIMLDNFSSSDIRAAIEIMQKRTNHIRPLIEVSGGISEQNIEKFLIPGVDIISIGSLTHSVLAIDFSLKINGIVPFNSSGESNNDD
ncbi:MAG: carboxylating nicotinate-nucleotide diphosphorylase [Candidatus Hodarchaeota archaeon]